MGKDGEFSSDAHTFVVEPGQRVDISIVASESPLIKPPSPGEIPYPVIKDLRNLVRRRGVAMALSYDNEGDVHSEFGNTTQEMEEILPVVRGLREAHARLPQVGELVSQALDRTTTDPRVSSQKQETDYRTTMFLYKFAKDVLGEAKPDEIV